MSIELAANQSPKSFPLWPGAGYTLEVDLLTGCQPPNASCLATFTSSSAQSTTYLPVGPPQRAPMWFWPRPIVLGQPGRLLFSIFGALS